DGELVIRSCLAFQVAARMRYLREPLARAAAHALRQVKRLGGDGGLVAIDRRGNIAMPYNSAGMYRGAISINGRRTIATFT
ncbi:MAG TPA: isoaspartyl peptidase/L-asparaginase, partial [Reyranellaceae bacterium]|nr:isoaspartyl peptidase/L-asparaginase [Reyranellaceae bacterium]